MVLQAAERGGVVAGPELELEVEAGAETSQVGPEVEPAPKAGTSSPVRRSSRKRPAAEVSGHICSRPYVAASHM